MSAPHSETLPGVSSNFQETKTVQLQHLALEPVAPGAASWRMTRGPALPCGSGLVHVTKNCFHLPESLRPTLLPPHLSAEHREEEELSPNFLITPSQGRFASAPGGPSTNIKAHSRNSNQTKHSAFQGPCLRNNKNTEKPQPSLGGWKLFCSPL